MSPTFASLSIRNYRIYALGAIVSNVGTWMGRVGQDWVVLTELTDHSASALGIVTGLQFLPMLLLAPWTGAVTDRYPKRLLLLVTQALLGLTALVGGLLVITGTAQLWHFYTLALMTGIATAFDNPARQTFVSEMVPRERLANAVALNSASFNLGRLVGPAVAGVMIAAIGTGPTLLANALTFAAVIVALTMLTASELTPAPRVTGRGSALEGLRYVRGRPDIVLVLILIFVLGTFGMNFQITIALMATQVFGKGSEEYGLLGSIMAQRRPARRSPWHPATPRAAAFARRLHRRGRGRGALADLLDLRRGPGLLRAHGADDDDDGQCHGADAHRPRDARPGHGALHGDLLRRDTPRRADHRVGRRRPRGALDDRHRGPCGRSHPRRGVLLAREARECPGELLQPATPPGAGLDRTDARPARGRPMTPRFRRIMTWAVLASLVGVTVLAAII